MHLVSRIVVSLQATFQVRDESRAFGGQVVVVLHAVAIAESINGFVILWIP